MRRAALVSFAVLAIVGGVWLAVARKQRPHATSLQEIVAAGKFADLVRWYDAQGLPDLRDAQIVSVASRTFPDRCGTGRPIKVQFLVESRSNDWIVFSPSAVGFWPAPNEPPGLSSYPKTQWTVDEAFGPGKDGEALLAYAESLRRLLDYRGPREHAPMAVPRELHLNAVTLARALLRRGHAAPAKKLFHAMETHARDETPGVPLLELLEEELFGQLLAPVRFPTARGNPDAASGLALDRQRLRDLQLRLGPSAKTPRWEKRLSEAALAVVETSYLMLGDPAAALVIAEEWNSRLPGDGDLRESIETLRKMGAETAPVTDDLIARMVFSLHTISSNQFHRFESDDAETAPKQFLVSQSHEAAPALLAALDDRCYTLVLGQEPSRARLRRVRDLAIEILESIASTQFSTPRFPNDRPRADEAACEKARQWWENKKKYPANSPASLLDQAIANRARDIPARFDELRRTRPSLAPRHLVPALEACTSTDMRRFVLESAAQIPGLDEAALVRDALAASRQPESRIVLAVRAHALGLRDLALRALFQLLEHPAALVDPPHESMIGNIAAALMLMDAPDGLARIAEVLPSLPAAAQKRACKIVGGGIPFPLRRLAASAVPRLPANVARAVAARLDPESQLSARILDAAERVLGVALTSQPVVTPEESSNEWSLPSFAEEAARALCDLRPEHYTERRSFVLEETESWLAHIRAVWRARQQGDQVPTEPGPPVAPAAAARIQPLLAPFLAEPQNRESVRNELIEQHGLGAFPVVNAEREKAAPRSAERKALDALALDLGWIVREVVLPGEPLPPALADQLRALRGKPLAAEYLASVVHASYSAVPDGKTGFHLDVRGAGDAFGCTLRFRWSEAKLPLAREEWAWMVTSARQLPAKRSDAEVRELAFAREVADAIAAARPRLANGASEINFYTHRGTPRGGATAP